MTNKIWNKWTMTSLMHSSWSMLYNKYHWTIKQEYWIYAARYNLNRIHFHILSGRSKLVLVSKRHLKCLKHPYKSSSSLSKTHAFPEQRALLEATLNLLGHVKSQQTPVYGHLSQSLSSPWQLKGKWSLLECLLCWGVSENIYPGCDAVLAHILLFPYEIAT